MYIKNNLIGNTPMIKIFYKRDNEIRYIYAKLEYYNLTGSIKDRVAYYMIEKGKKEGTLKEGMPIIEATSGNTGISLASIGRAYKYKVYIFMPDWVSQERVKIMKNFGAEVILISKEQGGFKKCIEEAKKLAENINGFLANQFSNVNNFYAHYETTGEEILEQINDDIGGFVSGVGTGGTLMGVGKKLKEKYKDLKITAIEPEKMPIISEGKIISNHKIEGIGDDFVPDLLDREAIDRIILIDDDDAINMSRKISRDLGIGVGISSGANLIGSIILQDKINKPVVTVFADDNKKYLSTELSEDLLNNEKFTSNKIELLSYENV